MSTEITWDSIAAWGYPNERGHALETKKNNMIVTGFNASTILLIGAIVSAALFNSFVAFSYFGVVGLALRAVTKDEPSIQNTPRVLTLFGHVFWRGVQRQ